MTLYYKTAFMPYLKKWKSMHRKPSMNEVLIKFTLEQFPGLLESIPSKRALNEFIEDLKLVVFSHRHQKNDDHLKVENP